MDNGLLLPLLAAAATLGSLHSLAPDHWLPFAALGRARGWSPRRTAGVTLLCGAGHVAASAVLGLLGLAVGTGMLEVLGTRLASVAGLLLLAFGAAYAVWGLRRGARRRLPGLDADAAEPRVSRMTTGSLLAIFALDPCLPLIPLVASAATLGAAETVLLLAVYGTATLTTMVALAMPARSGATALGGAWIERWGHAAAGALIVLAGIAAGALGI